MDSETNKQRIVLIDDEPGVLLALKLLLQLKNFEIEAFNNPIEALKFIFDNQHADSEKKIDYILCDLRMPQKTGLELLIESRALVRQIPFFLMSGHAEEKEQMQAIELGASGFLSKPFDPDQFIKMLS